MDQTVYHVLLEGRTVGPYDRRTIVGMRIKKALTSEHVLIGSDGAQLTVADLIERKPAMPFNPGRSSSFSVVQATYPAALVEVQGAGVQIPAFKGEVEARVQGGVLRVAGRFRRHLRWREDRAKIPLKDVVHARVAGSQVELWLRGEGAAGMQRVVLELFSPESARELVDWMTYATPLPLAAASEPVRRVSAAVHSRGLWIAVIGASVALGMMLAVLLYRGGH